MTDHSQVPRVGLFVTCLADLFRPSVGFAAVKLLEAAGCVVEVPPGQTCCGQPAFNSGDREDAAALARMVIAAFEPYDYLVAPSGSCIGTIRCHYPALLADDAAWAARAAALAARSWELTSFLAEVRGWAPRDVCFPHSVTYHDSCSGRRELGIREQPRALLAAVEGLELVELAGSEECCGFGGTFCVKFPEISNHLVSAKSAAVTASGAEVLLGGDLGCLLNIAGKLQREGSAVQCRHVAEVLADTAGEVPAIGAPRGGRGRGG